MHTRAIAYLLTYLLLLGSQITFAQSNYDIQKQRDLLDVSVSIYDEADHPVPYVTVWHTHSPSKQELTLSPEDLWRITLRYQSSFEFATRYHPIVAKSHVDLISDLSGHFHSNFSFQAHEGFREVRPDQMQLSYTFMKRGYLPAQLNLSVGREKLVTGKITLKHDPEHPIENQPYLQRFEAIRYEFSDTSKDEKISKETQDRNEKLTKELESLASQAIAAGNNQAAARIYMRMVYLPSVNYYNGKSSGWSHQELFSDRAIEYRKKAYSLDKENPFIVAESLYSVVSPKGRLPLPNPITPDIRKVFEQYLINFEQFLNNNKTEVWPQDIQRFAWFHQYSNDKKQFESTEKWWRELYEFEPKFVTKEFVEDAINRHNKLKFVETD